MSSVLWYWHRIRSMTPTELVAHGRRKVHQVSDRVMAGRRFARVEELPAGSTFPALPRPESAPEGLRDVLRRDVAEILRGRWMAFGYLPLQVDTPPRWHKDYLAAADLWTTKSALKLHHRLEGKADIKLIWEPNRWYSLVRLAQAAYVLEDEAAASACLDWLGDWVQHNPPYFGWNWTSGLESGLRLIQFAWIDALLTGAEIRRAAHRSRTEKPAGPRANASALLARIRARVLLPHLWFTWRDRSFGSSANNHLLGELAGLIIALVRWPSLTGWATNLETLQPLWEKEVLTQFAPDGGNREQALNYHLFGWEFCWQAQLALQAAGRTIPPEVEERLRTAAGYFTKVQVPEQQWDYGDSDSAYVTPVFLDWGKATSEWHSWLARSQPSPAIQYWIGHAPKLAHAPAVASNSGHWQVYPDTGLAIWRDRDWFLRWDLSGLGYLATAGHGHCDALHLSLWFRGQAVFIDPGTGAYHADRPWRDYLASWDAHNGPHAAGSKFPERKGAFLWSAQHEKPRWRALSDAGLSAELALPAGTVHRVITRLPEANGWEITDSFRPADPNAPWDLEVMWQLAPAVQLQPLEAAQFRLQTGPASLTLAVDPRWTSVQPWIPGSNSPVAEGTHPLRGTCSDAFRRRHLAPYLLLRARPGSGEFRTVLKGS